MNPIPPFLCLVALVIPVESTIFSTLLIQPIRCKNSHPHILYNKKHNSHYLNQPYIGKKYTNNKYSNNNNNYNYNKFKDNCKEEDHYISKPSINSFFFPSYLSQKEKKKNRQRIFFKDKISSKENNNNKNKNSNIKCKRCHPIINTYKNHHRRRNTNHFNPHKHQQLQEETFNPKTIINYPPSYRGTAQVSTFIDDEIEPFT